MENKRARGTGRGGEARLGPREPAVPFAPEERGRAGSVPLQLPVKGREGSGEPGGAGPGVSGLAGQGREGGSEGWMVIHGSGMRRAGPASTAPGLPRPAPAGGQRERRRGEVTAPSPGVGCWGWRGDWDGAGVEGCSGSSRGAESPHRPGAALGVSPQPCSPRIPLLGVMGIYPCKPASTLCLAEVDGRHPKKPTSKRL